MSKENFDKKWNKAKYIWKLDGKEFEIKKILNPKSREVYEDMYYRKQYFFTLEETRDWIRNCYNLRTPDGHQNLAPAVSDFKIIQPSNH